MSNAVFWLFFGSLSNFSEHNSFLLRLNSYFYCTMRTLNVAIKSPKKKIIADKNSSIKSTKKIAILISFTVAVEANYIEVKVN